MHRRLNIKPLNYLTCFVRIDASDLHIFLQIYLSILRSHNHNLVFCRSFFRMSSENETSNSTFGNGTGNDSTVTDDPVYPFAFVALFCCLIGIPANVLCMAYFAIKNRRKSTYISMLYMFMTLVDLVICLLCFPLFLSNLTRRPVLFNSSVFCGIWGYIQQIVNRLSVFCIGILSIVRTVSLICPFVHITGRQISVPIIIYAVFLFIQQSVPWWYGVEYFFYPGLGCGWMIESIPGIASRYSDEAKIMQMIFVLLEFVTPIIPISVSCVISIMKLKTSAIPCCGSNKEEDTGPGKGRNGSARSKLILESTRIRRSATITIIILTAIYIIFNLPLNIFMFCDIIDLFDPQQKGSVLLRQGLPRNTILTIIYTVVGYSIVFNSTINPVVYIIRIKKVRRFVINILLCRHSDTSMANSMFMDIGTTTNTRKRTFNVMSEANNVCAKQVPLTTTTTVSMLKLFRDAPDGQHSQTNSTRSSINPNMV